MLPAERAQTNREMWADQNISVCEVFNRNVNTVLGKDRPWGRRGRR